MVDLINKTKKFGNRPDRAKYGTIKGSTLDMGGGNDSLTVTDIDTSTIYLGIGNDTLNVSGTVNQSSIFLGNGVNRANFKIVTNSTINGGASADIITIQSGSGNTLNLGAKNDVLTLATIGADAMTIDGGSGFDTLVLNEQKTSLPFYYNAKKEFIIFVNGQALTTTNIEKVTFQDGISVRLSPKRLIFTGTEKADIASITASSGFDIVFNALGGDDVIADTARANTNVTIDGGAGVDTFHVSYCLFLTVSAGSWSYGLNTLRNIEKVTDEYQEVAELRANGAYITSQRTDGARLSTTSGTDTLIGTSQDDDIYGDFDRDVFDLSSGGKDTVNFIPTFYGAGTTKQFSIYGASKDDQFKAQIGPDPKVISDTRIFNAATGFYTGGSLKLDLDGGTIIVNFIATKPT